MRRAVVASLGNSVCTKEMRWRSDEMGMRTAMEMEGRGWLATLGEEALGLDMPVKGSRDAEKGGTS